MNIQGGEERPRTITGEENEFEVTLSQQTRIHHRRAPLMPTKLLREDITIVWYTKIDKAAFPLQPIASFVQSPVHELSKCSNLGLSS